MKYCIPDELRGAWERAVAEYDDRGVFFLEREYLAEMNAKTGAFSKTLDSILEGAACVAEDKDAALYAMFLYCAMEDRRLFLENLPAIEIPEKEFPFLALLPFVPYIERLYDRLKQSGIPEDVVSATVGHFEVTLFGYAERNGCLGMGKRLFSFMQKYIDFKILNVGRLFFELCILKDACMIEHRVTGEQILFPMSVEMDERGLYLGTPPIDEGSHFTAVFKETESSYEGTPVDENGRCKRDVAVFDKSEYFLRVPFGSTCLSVHIPAGGDLTREACEESYARAIEIFSQLYPELEFKAFRCRSWMMSVELRNILSNGSRVLEFQEPYLKCPCKTDGKDALYFVFKTQTEDYGSLPENTSLQRALKQIYLSGGCLYEYTGIRAI